jgi:hypothetical protein
MEYIEEIIYVYVKYFAIVFKQEFDILSYITWKVLVGQPHSC